MKKTVCMFIFILILQLALTPLSSARAPLSSPLHACAEEESYACIRSNDVFFYEREDDSSGLFLLPYTYYVKVLKRGVPYCYVQYLTDSAPFKAVYGYCKTAQLEFVDYTPARPYLYYTIEATYTLSDSSAFGDLSSVTLTYVYYGDYLVGSSVYHYVRLDEKTGYLPKTKELSYELNNDFHTSSGRVDPGSDNSSTEPGGMTPGQIALTVVIICLLAGGGFFAFRPKKEEPVSR